MYGLYGVLTYVWLIMVNNGMSIPRKLQHTPGAHPRQSPYPTMKGVPLQPIGKYNSPMDCYGLEKVRNIPLGALR